MKDYKNISEVRDSIDKLDSKLLRLISERKLLVDEAVRLKNKSQIVDKKRIKEILTRLDLKSKKLNLPDGLVVGLWKEMIKSFIEYERKVFEKKEIQN